MSTETHIVNDYLFNRQLHVIPNYAGTTQIEIFSDSPGCPESCRMASISLDANGIAQLKKIIEKL